MAKAKKRSSKGSSKRSSKRPSTRSRKERAKTRAKAPEFSFGVMEVTEAREAGPAASIEQGIVPSETYGQRAMRGARSAGAAAYAVGVGAGSAALYAMNSLVDLISGALTPERIARIGSGVTTAADYTIAGARHTYGATKAGVQRAHAYLRGKMAPPVTSAAEVPLLEAINLASANQEAARRMQAHADAERAQQAPSAEAAVDSAVRTAAPRSSAPRSAAPQSVGVVMVPGSSASGSGPSFSRGSAGSGLNISF